MRWVHVAYLLALAGLVPGCPRDATGPTNPDRAPRPDGVRAGEGSASVPLDAGPDAAVPTDAPIGGPIDGPLDVSIDAPVGPTPEEEARFAACADACTMVAVCYELVYGEDYYKGSQCMEECDGMSATDRADFARSAAAIEDLAGKRRRRSCESLIGE